MNYMANKRIKMQNINGYFICAYSKQLRSLKSARFKSHLHHVIYMHDTINYFSSVSLSRLLLTSPDKIMNVVTSFVRFFGVFAKMPTATMLKTLNYVAQIIGWASILIYIATLMGWV